MLKVKGFNKDVFSFKKIKKVPSSQGIFYF